MDQNEGAWQEIRHKDGAKHSSIVFEHPIYGEIKLHVLNFRNRRNASVMHMIMRHSEIPQKLVQLDEKGFWLTPSEDYEGSDREPTTASQRKLFKLSVASILSAVPHQSKPLNAAIRRFVISGALKYDPTFAWKGDLKKLSDTAVLPSASQRSHAHK
ncbi:MAG: hypothetical protein AABX01_03615 [Candidatus Micrarchaeota archaeon]